MSNFKKKLLCTKQYCFALSVESNARHAFYQKYSILLKKTPEPLFTPYIFYLAIKQILEYMYIAK